VLVILYGIGLVLSIGLAAWWSSIISTPIMFGLTTDVPAWFPFVLLSAPIGISALMMGMLLRRKKSARKILVIFAIIGIVVHLLTINLLAFVIDIVVLWYLSQKHVKEYFNINE